MFDNIRLIKCQSMQTKWRFLLNCVFACKFKHLTIRKQLVTVVLNLAFLMNWYTHDCIILNMLTLRWNPSLSLCLCSDQGGHFLWIYFWALFCFSSLYMNIPWPPFIQCPWFLVSRFMFLINWYVIFILYNFGHSIPRFIWGIYLYKTYRLAYSKINL